MYFKLYKKAQIASGVLILLIGLVVFTSALTGSITGNSIFTSFKSIFSKSSPNIIPYNPPLKSFGEACTTHAECSTYYCNYATAYPDSSDIKKCRNLDLPNGEPCVWDKDCSTGYCPSSSRTCSSYLINRFIYDECSPNDPCDPNTLFCKRVQKNGLVITDPNYKRCAHKLAFNAVGCEQNNDCTTGSCTIDSKTGIGRCGRVGSADFIPDESEAGVFQPAPSDTSQFRIPPESIPPGAFDLSTRRGLNNAIGGQLSNPSIPSPRGSACAILGSGTYTFTCP